LIYHILKIYVRAALLLFCKRITVHHPELFREKGPFLIGANHPNSFFDAILVGTFMKVPVHFMTRSDVFKYRFVRFLLERLNMIPVYRIRDGKDKLPLNENSFFRSRKALRKGHHVLIFVEGFCNNQTTLQALKKGGARILYQSWQEGIDVKMLPLWIRYDEFHKYGNQIDLVPGSLFDISRLSDPSNTAISIQEINQETAAQLETCSRVESPATVRYNRILLFPFAISGFLLHIPFYALLQSLIAIVFRKTVHYDSVHFAVLAFFYPLWLLFMAALAVSFAGILKGILIAALLPFLARAYVLWK
jgi:1-acyl-sn-glycerol-3-phosphate acyltransferase